MDPEKNRNGVLPSPVEQTEAHHELQDLSPKKLANHQVSFPGTSNKAQTGTELGQEGHVGAEPETLLLVLTSYHALFPLFLPEA